MATCTYCNQEMTDNTVNTCDENIEVIYPDGQILAAIPFTPEAYNVSPSELPERCHDCNIAQGGYHHPGCDVEQCPRCKGQLISCGCLDDEPIELSPAEHDAWPSIY